MSEPIVSPHPIADALLREFRTHRIMVAESEVRFLIAEAIRRAGVDLDAFANKLHQKTMALKKSRRANGIYVQGFSEAQSAAAELVLSLVAEMKKGTVGEWIKCKERLPDTAGNYLIYETVKYRVGIEYFHPSGVWSGINTDKITHWQPLPAPPSDTSKDPETK